EVDIDVSSINGKMIEVKPVAIGLGKPAKKAEKGGSVKHSVPYRPDRPKRSGIVDSDLQFPVALGVADHFNPVVDHRRIQAFYGRTVQQEFDIFAGLPV